VDRWLRRLSSFALGRGMSGSRPWMIVGIASVGMRALRRMSHPKAKVLFHHAIKVGDTFVVEARPRETARRRRRAGQ
jgi:hypothetical protein